MCIVHALTYLYRPKSRLGLFIARVGGLPPNGIGVHLEHLTPPSL